MRFKLIFLILFFIPLQLAFGFRSAQVSQNVLEEGRSKYQYLQQMTEMPHYGTCWKSAVEHVENGCVLLSENMQSDIALHITNCFLEMSGHDTYNCDLDKKPNLRKICIASMSDRAFNVYTEFFTHTQNICWFLRGQVWYEAMSENTVRVSQQLEESARNQENILKSQKESLVLQENLLYYGQNVENIMKDFQTSANLHQEMLSLVTKSLGSLQSWLIGELSWFDMIIFYTVSVLIIGIVTSSSRTLAARLPLLFLLIANAIVERIICNSLISSNFEIDLQFVQKHIYDYIWLSRKICIALGTAFLLYTAFIFQDLAQINHTLLQKIYEQNNRICKSLEERQTKRHDVSFYYENSEGVVSNTSNGHIENVIPEMSDTKAKNDIECLIKKKRPSYRKTSPSFPELNNQSSRKYNLRSKQSTPVL